MLAHADSRRLSGATSSPNTLTPHCSNSAPDAPAPASPAAAFIAAGFLLLLAMWASFSDLAFFQSTDSLIPIFAGTLHWSPFFWGQDRYGMVLPLLAGIVRDPATHFSLQLVLRSWVVLLTPLLIAHTLDRHGRWWLAGSIAVSLAIFRFQLGGLSFYGYHPYLQALVALLGGNFLWEMAPRGGIRSWLARFFGAVFLGVAAWITPSVLFWALPLWVFRAWHQAGWFQALPSWTLQGAIDWAQKAWTIARPVAPRVVWLVACVAGVLAWAHSLGLEPTPLGWTEWSAMPITFARMVRAWFEAPIWWTVPTALAPAAFFWPRWRQRPGLASWSKVCWVLVGAATCEALALSQLSWVSSSKSMSWRFASTGLFLVLTAGAIGFAQLVTALGEWALRQQRHQNRALVALALVLPVVAAAYTWGWPSAARQEAAKELSVPAAQVYELDAAGATHLLGNYWRVYPLAWRFSELASRHQPGRPVRWLYPLSARAESARVAWEPSCWACARIAVIKGDPWRTVEGTKLSLPELERVAEGPTFEIWQAKASCGPCPRPRRIFGDLFADGFESGELSPWSRHVSSP